MNDAEVIKKGNEIKKELERFAIQITNLGNMMLGLDGSEGMRAERTAERILTTRSVNAIMDIQGKEPKDKLSIQNLYTEPIEND